MLLPHYQPAQPGAVTCTSLPAFSAWPSGTVNNKSVTLCRETSHEHLILSANKKWKGSTKDIWYAGGNRDRSSGSAEGIITYISIEAHHQSHLLLHHNLLAHVHVKSGSVFIPGSKKSSSILCHANLQHHESLHQLAERSTKKKLPTQPGKDVWRPGQMDGGADKAGPAKSAKHQVLLPTNFDTMANESSTLEQSNTTTAGMLKASSHELEMSRKKAVCKDVRSPRNSPDISLVGTELPDISVHKKIDPRRRLYLVDMHALCYDGNRAQPSKVIEWMKLLLSQVAQDNPIIAVMDGERGNEYRKALMPEYKAKRNQFRPLAARSWRASTACGLREALPLIQGFLTLCHIPVVKLEMAEADDVIATLASQAQGRGLQVVVASPDMDFRQLLAPDVHMLLPLPEIGRWSFYTLQHYVTQNNMTPDLDLGLRCLLGDATDNISGLSTLDPRFGRKTALKLMQKHGSLEGLLKAAATRTVGKDYIQGALVQHADLLRRNMQVLSLRTDVPVVLKDQWCQPRSDINDLLALELLTERLQS